MSSPAVARASASNNYVYACFYFFILLFLKFKLLSSDIVLTDIFEMYPSLCEYFQQKSCRANFRTLKRCASTKVLRCVKLVFLTLRKF